jgi:hypothetical protein
VIPADNPLAPIVQAWISVLRTGLEVKNRRFGKDAAEAKKFYTGPYDFFWNQIKADRHMQRSSETHDVPEPSIKVQVNKVAEFVQIFGPSLYSRNPVRTVEPRDLPELSAELYAMMGGPGAEMVFNQALAQDQMARQVDAARAQLLQTYLNYTPHALGLRTHARSSIDDSLVSGAGVLWTERYRPPGANFWMVGSFHGPVDELVIDPDATSLLDAKWIARRRVRPVYETERKYGLQPGTLQQCGSVTSTFAAAAEDDPVLNMNKAKGQSCDVMVYYEVWSKMGIGGRLLNIEPDLRAVLEAFGDYAYMVIADGCPFPLNVPPEVINDPNGVPVAQERLQWPTPFWADAGWPCTLIGYHEITGSPWPLNHLAPAMGELKFINWAMGHLASKVRTSSRDFIAMLKSAGEDIKRTVLHGGDFELIEIQEQHGKTVDQIIQFLKHPGMNRDIWDVLAAMHEQFDKRTGLTELMYGTTQKQIRSGTEAQVRSDTMNIRPDDMAECVETSMSTVARREAFAARWHLSPDDVRPVLGPIGASWWEQLVYPADVREIIYNLEYRVEAGSAKKPNKARDQEQASNLMNNLFSPFFQYGGSTGDLGPSNALIEFWCKANDIRNYKDFQLKAAMPPAPAKPAPGQSAPPAGPTPGPAA